MLFFYQLMAKAWFRFGTDSEVWLNLLLGGIFVAWVRD